MGRKRVEGKPKGRMSSYAFFIQVCREEHKKKHPGESVVFADFSRKCAEKWKEMNAGEKRRFEDMAVRDKTRFDNEMSYWTPPPGETKGKKKRTKDPNAPKRALSAFFFFCHDERPKVLATTSASSIGEVAKEMGRRWEKTTERPRFEAMALNDKARYAKAIAAYRGKQAQQPALAPPMAARAPAAQMARPPVPQQQQQADSEEEDDDDEEEDESEEEEESDE